MHDAAALVAPFSMVRLELRGGSIPAPRSDKDTEYSMNYHLPECIPDHSTGTCP
ncbi:hypothetical protein QEG98_07460 [Myxococcus sp. MxC21-1]|uniref:hypothetical protein n=1 Tax=Myxococcus sp. MxC21-1 TaxID=3041439 RepID=UPI0029300CE8|nr:hypothetical protein [Myxococcus sp. MxC21-1]WNZ63550.1 hypothetical protein QEG98_07460 [Myxococcus sp. MxC21-1]